MFRLVNINQVASSTWGRIAAMILAFSIVALGAVTNTTSAWASNTASIAGNILGVPSGTSVSIDLQANGPTLNATTTSGTYSFGSLSPSSYASLVATATVGGVTYKSASRYLNEGISDGATLTDIDLTLEPMYVVSGTVTNIPAGATSATVSFSNSESGYPYVSPATVDLNTGQFTFTSGLPVGTFYLEASAYIYPQGGGPSLKLAGGSSEVTVTSSPAAVSIALDPLGSITGTITGIPADADNLSIYAWSQNSLTPSGNTNVSLSPGHASTATFSIPVLAEGDYSLDVWAYSSAGSVGHGQSEFSLTTNQNLTGVEVSLAAENTVSRSLSGQVLDSAGQPNSGVSVRFYSSNSYSSTTDSSGNYSVSGIQSNQISSFDFSKNSTATYSSRSFTTVLSGMTSFYPQVDLSVSEIKNLSFPTGAGILQGRVTEISGGSVVGVANAKITGYAYIQNGSVTGTVSTDAQGYYALSGLPLNASSIQVKVSSAAFDTLSGVFSLKESNSPRLKDFRMTRKVSSSGAITGSILDSGTSGALRGANVYISGPEFNASLTTDASGNFNFKNVPNGDYWLGVSKWSQRTQYKYTNQQVTVSGGQVNLSPITLQRYSSGSGRVTGVVVDQTTSKPVGGAYISLYSQGGMNKSTRANARGEWTISGLADDTYSLNIYSQSSSVYEWREFEPVIIDAGAQLTRTDNMRSVVAGTSSVTGVIRNTATYEPITGAVVSVSRTQGGFETASATTDSSGRYTIRNLPSGGYSVSVIASGFEVTRQAQTSSGVGRGGNYSGGNQIGSVDLEDGEAGYFNGRMTPAPDGRASIVGTVTTATNQIIEGAYIYAVNPNTGAFLGSTQSDENGIYQLLNVPSGAVRVFASSPSMQGLGSEKFAETRKDETLISGQASTVDLVVQAAGVITGTVLTNFDTVPECASVVAIERKSDGSLGDPVGWAQVNANTGTYKMDYLPAGNYFVSIKQECWNDKPKLVFGDKFWSSTSINGTVSPASYVTVAAGNIRSQTDVVVSEGAIAKGKVKIQTSAGTTGLPTGKYLQVNVYRQIGSEFKLMPQFYGWVSARSSGNYEISGLAPGTYKFQFVDTWEGNRGLQTTYSGSTQTLASASTMTVSAGQTSLSNDVLMSVRTPVSDPEAVPTSSLSPTTQDQIDAPNNVTVNEVITVNVGEEMAGEWVSVWAHSTPTSLGDWVQVKADGTVSATVSEALPAGTHRIVVQDIDNKVVGWTKTTVAASAEGTSSTGGVSRKATGTLSNIGTVIPGLDSPVKISPKKSTTKKQDVAEEASSSAELETAEPNFWIFGGLAAVLAAGVAGGVWLIRSRRS